METPPTTVDELLEALDRGKADEAAEILRRLPEMSQSDLQLLADYFQQGSHPTTPFVVKLERRGRGRPRGSYADGTRVLRTALGVGREQTNPTIEPEKFVGKVKPKSLAIQDYAALTGRSISSVKADLAKLSRRRRPKK